MYFPVEKKQGNAKYLFQPGDVVRFKICEKKNYSKVFLLKDFEVEEETTSVIIFLDKWEMKFGEMINKPTDYYYEVELNPDTYPDTFIGHNENGPAIFKLFPETKDVVEGEIPDPEENSAVSRMVVHFVHEYLGDKAEEIVHEILKEQYLETIVNEILKEEYMETIVTEVMNSSVMVVCVEGRTASHSASQINEHLSEGGVAVLKLSGGEYAHTWAVRPDSVIFSYVAVDGGGISNTLYTIGEDMVCTETDNTAGISGGGLGLLTVTVNDSVEPWQASHTAAQIIAHMEKGGTVILKQKSGNTASFAHLYGEFYGSVMFFDVNTSDNSTDMSLYTVHSTGEVTAEVFTMNSADASEALTTAQAAKRIADEVANQLKSVVKTVNGATPDAFGNVTVEVPSGEALPEVTKIDFSQFEAGVFKETVDGVEITHNVTFDDSGRPVLIDDLQIVWGAV